MTEGGRQHAAIIRNRLQLADDPGRRRAPGFVVTVCAARSDTGVSTVAQSLAESFNAAGVQTALLDAGHTILQLGGDESTTELAGPPPPAAEATAEPQPGGVPEGPGLPAGLEALLAETAERLRGCEAKAYCNLEPKAVLSW